MIHSLVKAFGLLESQARDTTTRIQLLRPLPAQLKELSAYHDRDYLERLLKGEVDGAAENTQPTEFGLEEVHTQFYYKTTCEYLILFNYSRTAPHSLISRITSVI